MKFYVPLFIVSMPIFVYAMEEVPLLLPQQPSLKELDVLKKHNSLGNRMEKRTQVEAYTQWVTEHEPSTLTWAYDSENLDLQHKDIETLNAIINHTLSTVFHRDPMHAKHLQHIDVSHNQLPEVPLEEITRLCTQLRTFKATDNKVRYVSVPRRHTHDNLTELDLSHNALTTVDMDALLTAYPGLQTINVSFNPLKTIQWNYDHSTRPIKKGKLTLHLCGTELPQEEIAKVMRKYNEEYTKPVYSVITHTGIMGLGFGVIVGYIMALTLSMNAIDGFGSMIGGGFGLGTFTSLATYVCKYPTFKRIQEKIKERVVTKELEEVIT